jgi:hypothetical protein
MVASYYEQPVPIFQQLARGHPHGRDDDVKYPLSLRNVEESLFTSATCVASIGSSSVTLGNAHRLAPDRPEQAPALFA